MRIIELRIGVTTADELPTALTELLAAFDTLGEDPRNVSVDRFAVAVNELNTEDSAPPPPAPPAVPTPPTLAPPPVPPTAAEATIPPLAPPLAIVGAAPLAPPPVAVVLDSSGLPWDERIHASSKAFKATGEWRGKRNLHTNSPGLLEQVTAELRAVYPVPPAPGAVTGTPGLAAVPPVQAAAPGLAVPPTPALPAAPPLPPAGAIPVTVESVLLVASKILAAAKDQPTIEAHSHRIHDAMVSIGLPEGSGTNDLLARPDLFPAADQALRAAATELGVAV